MSIKHKIVPIQDVTEADMMVIKRGVDEAKIDADQLYSDFLAGKMITIRVTNEDEHGIFLFQENRGTDGKLEWFCVLLATSGAAKRQGAKYLQELSRPIEALAKSEGVARLRASQIPKLYEYITQPLGWTIERYEVVKEL